MLMMDLQLVAGVIDAELHGSNADVEGIGIDSRSIKKQELFFAIPGDQADPHDYLGDVLAKGASAAVVERLQPIKLPQLLVKNSFEALGKLATSWRDQFSLPIIALTGSNGKTSLKNMIASILLAAYEGDESKVLYTHGNLNSGFGLPLTLMRLASTHRAAVLEMGMSSLGEIEYISKMARPQVAVINNVFPAHVGKLGSLENIAKAKAEIFKGLGEHGIAVLNRDDAFYDYWRHHLQDHEVVTFGFNTQSTVFATDISQEAFPSFCLHTPVGQAFIQLKVMGEHNVKNALAAAAAAYALAIPFSAIVKGLETAEATPGRLRKISFKNGAVLLDDAYNANPGSMKAGMDVLAKYPGKRILVMGDMRELGSDELRYHQQIGEYANTLGLQSLFALGELSEEAAVFFEGDARHFKTHEALIEALKPLLQENVAILVKGSASMNMSKIVKALEALEKESVA